MAKGSDTKVGEAVEFLRQVADAESQNRARAIEDLKFRYVEQWPAYATASRGQERPQLTINETDAYIRQVTNSQRQQRPRIKVHPVDNTADIKVAEIITGITRHVEVNSDADNAYDTAFDFSASIGWGYWRVDADYIREDSFDQDIYINVIDNPFCVYFDHHSHLPDGSDAERCLITDVVPLKQFKRENPDAQTSGFTERGSGDQDPEWVTTDAIRLAEYMYLERIKAELVKLSDGRTIWADQLPEPALLEATGLSVIANRQSAKRVVKWRKQTAFDILDEKTLPGRWIPVVPVYGTTVIIDGRRIRQGLVRPAMDPQRMVNFWQSAITEFLALAPKAKWLLAEGADENHENEWSQANVSPRPVLRYKTTGVDGQPIPPPQRIAPDPPPEGMIQASFMATQNLQKVLGIFDPAVRGQQTKSGKAIIAERSQSENSNYHYYDNFTRSVKHTGRIILDIAPKILDTERVMRIIGDDGKPDLITINQKVKDPETGAIQKVLNDVTVGLYDVVMDTGPGFETKRQETLETFVQILQGPLGQVVSQVGADLIVRLFDVSGMQELGDRLAAANPLSKIDKNSEIPPQAQIVIKTLQQQVEQLNQKLQQAGLELKYKTGIEHMKQDGETKRALLISTTKAHNTEMIAATRQHDVEARAVTAQNVAEINGLVDLLLHHLDTSRLEREISRRDAEQQTKHDEPASTLP